MNRKYNILTGAVLAILACSAFQACQQDDLDLAPSPDSVVAELVAEGRYLSAVQPETFASADDPKKGEWFDVDTPYRLFAFTKAYDSINPKPEERATNFRFNFVAWEDSVNRRGTNIHFIKIVSDPAKWFGFKALDGEDCSSDSLVSLDFYSFSYGKKVEDRHTYGDYIPTLPDKTSSDGKDLHKIYRTETVDESGKLNDLLRAELRNRNINDVVSGDKYSTVTQSVLPFRHCFSRLRFLVVQEEGSNDNGDPAPCFGDIRIEEVKLTGTYNEGRVYLEDGKIALQGVAGERQLSFRQSFLDSENMVTTKQVDMGEMLIFPSDGACLRDDAGNSRESYDLGIKITVKSKDSETLEKFLAGNKNDLSVSSVTGPDQDGWCRTTLIKPFITDNYDTELPSAPLHFKQNNAYTLVIAFMNNAVRIITVIPMVEEWLPGEGTDEVPWDDQEVGQPQMFDNVVWSDRNLGAGDYDPRDAEKFEKSMGYFYQAGRNIPYYPFKYHDYVNNKKVPTLADLETPQHFGNENTGWTDDFYRFYPIVDPKILNMGSPDWWVISRKDGLKEIEKHDPQMFIPEVNPSQTDEKRCFDFMVDNTLFDDDMHWEDGQQNQPTTGTWVIPTSAQFMSIFPSTPHAGNITFRTGAYNNEPMSWCPGNDPGINDTKTLRVTVPYYKPGIPVQDGKSDKYRQAWQTLHDNGDVGTTHESSYTVSPGTWGNVNIEPDGDPADGFASIYVISKEREEDVVALKPGTMTGMYIREWGTIYGIKRVYTAGAYRMRWRAIIAAEGTKSPSIYIEICRYRCSPDDTFDETTYKDFDWDHPAARLYFPVTGLGDFPGKYINYGTECQYATSDPIVNGKTSAVQIKITGDNPSNAYIAIVKNHINRHFGMQIRPVRKGGGGN